MDIFAKDILLIPICEGFHWYLLCIINPGLLCSPEQKKETIIVVFDSLKAPRDSALDHIKSYLKEELKDKKGIEPRNIYNILDVNPPCPQQTDVTSCGVFLLHFAEQLLNR